MGQMRGIILEGFSHAGKTSVLRALKLRQAQDESSERSVIVLGEHYSQVLHNIDGTLIKSTYEEHLELLKDRVVILRQLNEWATKLGRASRRARGIFFILERFHLNHRVAYPDKSLYEIELLEQELVNYGAKCALLTISPEIGERRIQSRTPEEWHNKKSEEISAAVNQLLTTQLTLRTVSRQSAIPTIEINTDTRDWGNYAEDIIRKLD